MYPKLEGRFPQVAGISFGFDPRKPPGSRVDTDLVRIGDEYLNLQQTYNLATKNYMATGCDGYTMLKDSPIVVSYCKKIINAFFFISVIFSVFIC